MRRCPVLDMGNHSVVPWIKPKGMDCSRFVLCRCIKNDGDFKLTASTEWRYGTN